MPAAAYGGRAAALRLLDGYYAPAGFVKQATVRALRGVSGSRCKSADCRIMEGSREDHERMTIAPAKTPSAIRPPASGQRPYRCVR